MHEYAPLHILGYGATREESWASFLEDFASYWDGIAQEPDTHLHESAREFKRKLLVLSGPPRLRQRKRNWAGSPVDTGAGPQPFR